MHIHIQNPASYPPDPITQAQWQEAAARAGGTGEGHRLTIANSPEAFTAELPTMEALIAPPSLMHKMFPAEAPSLRLIFTTSAGVERLAPFDMLPPGCMLANNRGTHSAKAGEYGIMAMLMLANLIPTFTTAQRHEKWERIPASVIRGRRVTIIGVGGLGGPAAAHARAFGLEVTGVRTVAVPHPDCDRVIATERLDEVLPETDFLLLAAPLTRATHHMLDRRRIGLLPRGAGVINIGRGGLIEQDALLDALDSGALGGAVLDVFTPEPVPPGHRLWSTPRLVMTPHMSCDDPKTYNALTLDIFFTNLAAFMRGDDVPNRVDISKGY